jgi:hypothetical protein
MTRSKHLTAGRIWFGVSLVLFSLFSYSLTDPNLVLSSWSPYWQFQQWMWQTFFLNAPLLSWSYFGLITSLWLSFFLMLTSLSDKPTKLSWKHILLGSIGVAIPLIFSYNALSHDIFNYIFNAKMVLLYHADPHLQTALNFATDPWTRFMHNTHTPAPYGYGWTVISLIPSLLGAGKFLPTWLLFKGMSWISWILTSLMLYRIGQQRFEGKLSWSRFGLWFFSPLVLIEVLSSGHNDLWMMLPAMLSVATIAEIPKSTSLRTKLLSGMWLLLSVSIKYASLALLPVWFALFFQRYLPESVRTRLQRYWPVVASLLMFLPLLSSRSQYFHPWYLLWPLVWLPWFGQLEQQKIKLHRLELLWQSCLVAVSISSTLRYLPWLVAGAFYPGVLLQQQLITFAGLGLGLICGGSWWLLKRVDTKVPDQLTRESRE